MSAALVIFLIVLSLVVAPWALMVALGILGVSVSFFEAVGASWLLALWLGIVRAKPTE